VSHEAEYVSVDLLDEAIVGPTEAGGVLHDGIHDGLNIGRGTTDDAKDLAGRRLLLERFSESLVQSLPLSRLLLERRLQRRHPGQ